MDSKRIRLSGRAISVRGNDLDTDRIIPARYLRCVTFDGLGDHAFEDDRAQARKAGQAHPFDKPEFQGAEILFVNANFGCGSSREHAPQSLIRWGAGIKAIVGESFAEIFFGNCLANGVPCARVGKSAIEALMAANEADPGRIFTLDLEAMRITATGAEGDLTFPVEMPEGARKSLIEGRWDTTAELFEAREQILARAASLPYWGHWR